jgi:calcineurin-like phosphoesterase family protein
MMNEQKIEELRWLRQLYIEHLSEIVTYNKNPRPRVAHPGKWAKLESVVALNEGIDEPLMIPPMEQDRKVWVWSDQHFFHKNIIEFSERPYDSVEQMNEYLIANYNDYVGEDDICIWVGDVGFKGNSFINEHLDQCNGYKILIVGNHDFNGKKLRNLNFDETHLIYTVDYPDVSMVFTHYPMDNIPWPWVNIHGHLHAFPNPDTGHLLHINVNCEVQEYKPRLLDDIVKQAKMRVIAAEM